jgi:phospholipase C
VNHVVIMIQENRSFDHYFGQMTAYRATNGYPINGSPATIEDESSGSFSNFSPATGASIAVYHSGSVCTEDLTPDWTETHKNFDWTNPLGPVPIRRWMALPRSLSRSASTQPR